MHKLESFLLSVSGGNDNDRVFAALLFVCYQCAFQSLYTITGETISAACQTSSGIPWFHYNITMEMDGNGWNGKQLHTDRESPFYFFRGLRVIYPRVASLDWTSVANSLQSHSGNTSGNRRNVFKNDMSHTHTHYIRLLCCASCGNCKVLLIIFVAVKLVKTRNPFPSQTILQWENTWTLIKKSPAQAENTECQSDRRASSFYK